MSLPVDPEPAGPPAGPPAPPAGPPAAPPVPGAVLAAGIAAGAGAVLGFAALGGTAGMLLIGLVELAVILLVARWSARA